MFIAITIFVCFTAALIKWSMRHVYNFYPDVVLDNFISTVVKSVAGRGTHIYVDIPGKGNKISVDCGVDIPALDSRSLLGDHIFLTNTSADRIAALFSSILNARHDGAIYCIYVPPSTNNKVVKKMIALMSAFERIGSITHGDDMWMVTFLGHEIILKEARDDMIVSNGDIIVRAVESHYTRESCAYIVYTKITAATLQMSNTIEINGYTYEPLATFSGNTSVALWENYPHVCQSKYVFAECTRFTGSPEAAHANLSTHITDLAKIEWSHCEHLFLYNISEHEKIIDITAALNKHMPYANTIGTLDTHML